MNDITSFGKFGGLVLTLGEDNSRKITIIDEFAQTKDVSWTGWTDQTLIPIMPVMCPDVTCLITVY